MPIYLRYCLGSRQKINKSIMFRANGMSHLHNETINDF